MCGIAGALVFDGPMRLDEPYIDRMRDTMAHRGPDGAATWLSEDRRVGLGFRRLAIIDLSHAADQPMANEDGRLRIVFNGEIYNHAAIRTELELRGGHTWVTDHSDSEVIIHAYEEWGVAAFERFRGMFAIGLWDARDQSLLLVRDRIGIKPLYWTLHDGRLLFASEIKAIVADRSVPRQIDEQAFFHYLSFLTTPAPNTLFRGIRKLPPGSWLRIHCDGRIEERRWWDVWDHTTPLTDVSDDEIAERVLDELRTSVKLRKVSDVPVGVFLSGGIDSSTNAALFSEGEDRPVKTFSIGYEGEYDSYKNELVFARKMAAEVGADHHERLLTQDDLIDFLPRMVQLQDEPIADPVCVPVYYVSKLARDAGVVVAQVGEGADELFYGYWGWKRMLDVQRLNEIPAPRFARHLAMAGLDLMGRSGSDRYEFIRRAAFGQPVFWGGAEAYTQRQKERLLSSRLKMELRGLTSWDVLEPIHNRFMAAAWETSSLNWMSYLDLNLRLPELLLMRVDKMSMGVSLEGRVPFLDHEFVSLAMSIPTEVKTRTGLKYVLKKAVRGLIPDELIDRPKQGFGVPIAEWYQDRLGDQIKRDVTEFTRATDLLDPVAVNKILENPRGHQPWYLHNLALWWREYIA